MKLTVRHTKEEGETCRLRPITATEFVSRFRTTLEVYEGRFAFFLGAGCSISSGIPGAADLTRAWMRRLNSFQNCVEDDFLRWASQQFPDYSDNDAGRFYSDVMDRAFPSPAERQMVVEQLIEGHDPGFGYAVLAKLMTDPQLRGRCNFALTTNFDDLVADAIYLYTRRKPLVIGHHSLCSFVEVSRRRPIVLKLHGDAWIEPLNTPEEIDTLNESLRACLGRLAQEMGIVFIGYGGNDLGISRTLSAFGKDMLKWGVYWVNDYIPNTEFGKWLLDRRAIWVKHVDFDQLMALLQTEFQLSHPDYSRFKSLQTNYITTFESLVASVERKPTSKEKDTLSAALLSSMEQSHDWRVWASYARRHSDILQGRKIFDSAITKFPGCAPLLSSYANFLADRVHDPEAADEYYNRALSEDSNCIDTLTDYAAFLEEEKRLAKATLLSEKADSLARQRTSQ